MNIAEWNYRLCRCLLLTLFAGWPGVAAPAQEKQPEKDAAAAPTEAQIAHFESKIRPVLVKHCYDCHSAEADTAEGGLRVDSREALLRGGDRGPAVVPGDPGASLLITAQDTNKVYGATLNPTGYTAAGLLNGDSVTHVTRGRSGSVRNAPIARFGINTSNGMRRV